MNEPSLIHCTCCWNLIRNEEWEQHQILAVIYTWHCQCAMTDELMLAAKWYRFQAVNEDEFKKNEIDLYLKLKAREEKHAKRRRYSQEA